MVGMIVRDGHIEFLLQSSAAEPNEQWKKIESIANVNTYALLESAKIREGCRKM